MDKKDAVINTARELFTKYGYKKVSMDEIAKLSGVTKKTIYTYFKDKDSMFLYFIQEELEKMKNEIEKKKNKDLPFIESVASSLYDMLVFRKNSLLISTISNEMKTSDDNKCRSFLKVYDDEIINYLEDNIKLEVEAGNIKKCDTHLTSFIIYKVFLSVLFEYDLDIDEKKVTKEVTTILNEGLFN
jgi:AcrR family transcriptional regulator